MSKCIAVSIGKESAPISVLEMWVVHVGII